MGPFQEILLPVMIASATMLFFHRRKVREALEDFNRRGGPPTPMHPSPAGDDSLLRPNSRNRAKVCR